MQSIGIFILTTTGASRIVYLGKEDAESGVSSAIRLDGETRPLRISERYGDFVDTFVQRFSGHRIYRADVGLPIDGGASWQLGLLLAHWALEDESTELAVEEKSPDLVLFVTGELRDRPARGEIAVTSVTGIGEKLRAAESDVLSHLRENKRVYVIAPEGNRPEFEAAVPAGHPLAATKKLFVQSFDEVVRLLKTPSDAGAPADEGVAATPKPSKKRRQRALVASVLGTAFVCGLIALYVVSQGETKVGPVSPDIAFNLNALGPEDPLSCSENRFYDSPEEATPVPAPDGGSTTLVNGAAICSFELVAENRTDTAVTLYSFLYHGDAADPAARDQVITSSRTGLIHPKQADRQQHPLPRFRLSSDDWHIIGFAVQAGRRMPSLDDLNSVADLQRAFEEAARSGAPTFQRHMVLKQ